MDDEDITEDSPSQAQELDEEFRRGLVAIRPYLDRLASVDDAHLCRNWLEYLHLGWDNRPQRNLLLAELLTHVKSGVLGYPFDRPPAQAAPPLAGEVSYELVEGRFLPDDSEECLQPSFNEESERVLVRVGHEGRRQSEPPTSAVPGRFQRYSDPEKLPSRADGHDEREDDGHTLSLHNTISTLRAQNEALTHELDLYKKTCQRAQDNLNTANEEIISLKAKLSELQRINSSIEKSHNKALREYKKSITDSLSVLSDRLKEVSDQKLDLFNAVNSLRTKLEDRTDEELETTQKKLKKEIECLKRQLASEKEKSQSLESTITMKDEKLAKVEKQVKRQCSQMQREVCHIKSEIDQVTHQGQNQLRERINGLKQDVSRLERANKKLVAEYELKLEECRKERGVPRYGCGDSGGLLEKTVAGLEERYRAIVSELEAKAAKQRERDSLRIRELEEKLAAKHKTNSNKVGK